MESLAFREPGVNFHHLHVEATRSIRPARPKREEEYAGYLSPAVLAGLPVATTIGNHDSLNPDYTYHFNNPNATENGKTQVYGGDYYYSYGRSVYPIAPTPTITM